MVTHTLQLLNSDAVFPHPSPRINLPAQQHNRLSRNTTLCCSTRHGGESGDGGGGFRWNSNAGKTTRTQQQFGFNFDDDFFSSNEEGEEDDEFGFFRRAAKQRVWWSGDPLDVDDDDDDDEDGFGVFEGSIDIAWIFKVLRAFGWMLPAIIISMLLGTGPNAFFMALALPLAQSALSLAIDTLWGSSNDNPRPKARAKKRPFARAASNIGISKEEKEQNSHQTDKGTANYQSWVASNDVSVKNRKRRMPSFGGWDELDKRGSSNDRVPEVTPTKNVNESRQQKKGKLSRRARSKDRPLLLRLLIAIFPFLGTWTKLL